ncbi:MAG: adenylate/guanylate cyclase domain-containing protein [Pseudomonadota bacterium]
MADMFDQINTWLIDQLHQDVDLSDTMGELAQRLLAGGVPVYRMVIGRSMLHPVIGLVDLTWDADTGLVERVQVSREKARRLVDSGGFANTPFGRIASSDTTEYLADLTDPETVAEYALFQKLSEAGVTAYAAFQQNFGAGRVDLPYEALMMHGAMLSYCTRRFSGFTDENLAGLRRILPAIFACVRVATDRQLVNVLLETYLGRISGHRVLTGQSARGDIQQIDCALMYSDLAGSLKLSQNLDGEEYIALLNAYFDCTAGAVLDHGGEVLKFVGDGILAIFPFDDAMRTPGAMCAAALSAARDAFARADRGNAARSDRSASTFSFGVGLHVGQVLYGNVGTNKRLDFTATGPAVGLASRCEALTRTLEHRLIATSEFAAACAEAGEPIGQHAIAGFEPAPTLFTYRVEAG